MLPEQQAIYWYSGLYLQPQHFQSADLHQSWMHTRHWQLAQPWNFGVIDCQINNEALIDFTFEISKLKLLLPEGLYLEYPGNCQIEKRSFRNAWKYRDRPFTLWLALRKFDPQRQNVSVPGGEQQSAVTRWINNDSEQVMRDVYHQGPETSIPRITYNVRLMWQDEQEEAVDYACFPLIRFRFDGQNVITDRGFSPPAVTLYGCAELGQLIDHIFHELSSRARMLEEYKRSERLVNSHESTESMIQLLAMRSLNRVLPLLTLYRSAPAIHPWMMYATLAQLIGELSSFSDDCNFSGEWSHGDDALLSYDHHNLIACFDSARRVLLALLNGLILEENTYITLERDEHDIYSADIERSQSAQAGAIYLLVRSAQFSREKTLFGGVNSLKLSSRHSLDAIIQHALPGVSLQLCTQPPRGVPKRSDCWYLQIDRSSELWKKIEFDQKIGFFWTHAPEDLQVQLLYMVTS